MSRKKTGHVFRSFYSHFLTADAGVTWFKQRGNTAAADPDPQFFSWWVHQQGSEVRFRFNNLYFSLREQLDLFQLHCLFWIIHQKQAETCQQLHDFTAHESSSIILFSSHSAVNDLWDVLFCAGLAFLAQFVLWSSQSRPSCPASMSSVCHVSNTAFSHKDALVLNAGRTCHPTSSRLFLTQSSKFRKIP